MADEKYLQTEEDMKYFLETGHEEHFSAELEKEELNKRMKASHITPVTLPDSSSPSGYKDINIMSYAVTPPSGGEKIGFSVGKITKENGEYIVRSDYGMLTLDTSATNYVKALAGSVLDGYGLKVDYNNPNFVAFCNDFARGCFGALGCIDGRDLPAYYKLVNNGINYYLGLNDYKIFGEWFRQQGILPYMEQSTYDDILVNNILKVRVGSISTDTMINRVVSNWIANTDLSDYHAIPNVTKIKSTISDMVNRCKNNFPSQTGTTFTPNVFNIRISGSARLGRIDIDVMAYYIKNATVTNKSNTYFFYHEIERNGGCGQAVYYSYRFGGTVDWEEGSYMSVTTPFEANPNVGKYSEDNLTGIAGFSVLAKNESYSYSNFNATEKPSSIDPRFDFVTPKPDFTFPDNDEDIIDYLKRTKETDEDPSTDPEDDTPIKFPKVKVPTPFGDDIPPWEPIAGVPRIVTPRNPTPTPPPTPEPSKDEGSTPDPTAVTSGMGKGLFTVYNPTSEEISAFGGFLWSSNIIEIMKTVFQNPLDGVLSLQLLYATPETGGNKEIVCGYIGSGVSAKEVTNQFIEIDCGGINLFEHYGDARDYAPYTEISLFLPFIGFVDLDVYEVMGGVIRVKYIIDVLTGSCLASVFGNRDGSDKVLYTYNGNCSVQLPLTSADKSQIITGAVSGAISGGKSGMKLGSIIGKSPAGAGIGAAVGGLTGAAWGGFTGGVSINRSGEMGANVGALGIKTPYLLVKRYIAFSASGYGGLLGYADNYRCTVGDISGFCVFSNPVVNINATASELDEIMNYLTTGIIV